VHSITGVDSHYEAVLHEPNNPRLNGIQYRVGTDSAYPHRPWLQKGFSAAMAQQLPGAHDYNLQFSSLRESVEWGFGKQYMLWPFIDWEKVQKVQLSPTELDYFVAAFFTNCHTCAYGSLTSSYFDCNPPTLEEYLAM
jgi:hypothetical protein